MVSHDTLRHDGYSPYDQKRRDMTGEMLADQVVAFGNYGDSVG